MRTLLASKPLLIPGFPMAAFLFLVVCHCHHNGLPWLRACSGGLPLLSAWDSCRWCFGKRRRPVANVVFSFVWFLSLPSTARPANAGEVSQRLRSGMTAATRDLAADLIKNPPLPPLPLREQHLFCGSITDPLIRRQARSLTDSVIHIGYRNLFYGRRERHASPLL